MKKLYPVLIFAALIFIVLWQLFFSNTNYYLVCVAVLIISMLPFFSSFERGEHTAKDITLIASLTAIAVVSRAVFYLVPQVKPIAAVVGVSGAVLGAKRGYLIGALSMLLQILYSVKVRGLRFKWWLWQVWGFASVWCFAALSLLKSHLQLSDFCQCLSFMGL